MTENLLRQNKLILRYLRDILSRMIEESSYDNLAVHLFPNNSKQSMRQSLINLERKEGSKKI
jgi:hypothetical protein